MGRTVMLRELCCSRAGDKSDTLNLSLIPYDPANYELLGELVTAEKVKEYFGSMVQGDVVRYDLPVISAYNFVLRQRSPAARPSPCATTCTARP